MNRRNAIRALMLGAPAAAFGMVAGPAVAHGGSYTTGEAGAELLAPPKGFSVVPGSYSPMSAEFARAITIHIRQALPEAIAAHNRNPMKRA